MKNVTLRQLKVFEAVARHLSFSRAAEELHLTQPAVSMQVHSLEDQAGSALFEQVGKKVFLTTAGEELLRHARLIAQQLREADEALAAIRGVRGGRLTIGVVSTAKYFAPRLLAVFRRTHPEVELRLGVHNRGVIVRQLADNEIDLAIMGSPPREFETISQIIAEHPLVKRAIAELTPLSGFARFDDKVYQAAIWPLDQDQNLIGFLIIANILLLMAGNFMEPSSIVLIMAPILFPVAVKLGIHPVHLGILMVVNMEVGMCHPPVGLNLYVASGIAKMGITELTIAVWPWLLTMLIFLGMVTYIPEISLWLPRVLGML